MPAAFCQIYAQFDQVGDRLPEDWAHLADLGLVADVTVSLAQAARSRETLARVRAAGGLVSLNWYPHDADPTCSDPNWWRYDEDTCLRLVRIAQTRFAALGLGELEALNTYTPGNSLVAALRRAGIRHLTGFCAPTVIEDGGWSIAQYGSPLSPFFVSDEDFRKPENPAERADPLLIASMELRNPLVCARHWSEGPWCPLNAQAADRWLEPSATPWPFIRIAEDWIRQGELDGVQRFFTINLQYFFAGACREHNRAALTWLAVQCAQGRLEVGGLRTWAARLRGQGGFVPQATWWRGEMAGFHVGNRPGFYPDTVVDESLTRQAIFSEGRSEPQRLYDYRPRWSCHPFKPEGGDPASADASGLSVTVQTSGDRLTATVVNTGAARDLPLALWGQLDRFTGGQVRVIAGACTVRVLRRPTGCGALPIIEGTWAVGTTTITLAIEGVGSGSPERCRRRWGNLVEAQTFVVDRRPCTVLALQAPARVLLGLRAAGSRWVGAAVESLVGLDRSSAILANVAQPIVLDGTRLASWVRIWDRHADEIELEGVAEAEVGLRQRTRTEVDRLLGSAQQIPVPGYQLHGDLLDPQRWDLALGRAAGDDEIQRITARWHALRSDQGTVLIAAHPGVHLPCGSITKVLGHRFDRETCAPGFSFQELCADYPQAWAPGVAGWVQWRHLNVAVAGTWNPQARYRLHVHACDAESRGLVQRIHLYDPDAAAGERIEICVERGWNLPVGIDARFDAAAFRSCLIPQVCRSWKRIGIWISPLEKQNLHHWIDEQGAAGILMHLWLTCDG